jgi:tetratricopeptide (TPR) repeat protein
LEKADDAFSRLDFDTGRRDYESAESMAPDNAEAKDGLQKVNKYQLEATAYLLKTWPADMCLIVTAPVHCPGPLGEEELERWTSRESELWLFNVVRQCRVNFKVTPEIEGRLRAAHMSESLIAAIKNAQPQDSGRVRGFAGSGTTRTQQQTIDIHLAEADVAFAVGDYDHALAEYEAVKQLQPENARANQGIEKVRRALAAEGSASPANRTPQ